jgi:hypothetical protein
MAATPNETVMALLERSRRDFVPIRRAFVQAPERGGGPGPLASFVRQRRMRSLDLYLLAHAVASKSPFDARFPSAVWARALGDSRERGSAAMVSKQWSWLEVQSLVSSRRVGRLREITLLKEDGSGDPYIHPTSEGNYFKLPYAYWKGNFHNRMGLPAKAVLLVSLSLQDDFLLPTERGAAWYGLSRDTVRKGLRTLRLLGLLSFREVRKNAPLAPRGFTFERRYRLRDPFRPDLGGNEEAPPAQTSPS